MSDKEAWNVQHIHPRGKLCVWGGRLRRSSAGRRSSIVTKPTVKEAKERRESEREPKKTAKSAELAKSFKEVETDEELEPAHSSTSGYKPHFFDGRLAPDKPISGRMLPDVEEPIQIIMDRATSKTMDAFVVFVTMEDAMRCAETMLPDVEEPIHIIMDQATSKTMDMFEELVTMGDAMFCVEKLSYVFYLTYLG
ncbi:hypothetical protein RAB80_005234 [Fusarium oxysporum f. sp. vasinfectum]|uniref:Uncharacterized protein n=1 Tax=Fusarium oxysporum f. sp. vasinfectum 25433 TaxID=1089449 RepID=X0LU59_FUSOX|nr:hypothetical protein FOTG_08566 [Fusarium oxysporum f. sp. vasinfectum 25433]KAK2680053.1 hypothetical protein RAB80_005234 [Fusarium oxysporum f. sp. vasinfectum]KAK2935425.1 hypothetical protein FoTM2_003367 [Fusarium oxysporum f. sp. vasinfectum]